MVELTSLDLSSTIIEFPERPSKWDIIPIHASDRGTFKFCRRKWNWSSPSQRNLVAKIEFEGVYMPFWFGTGIHYACEMMYNPAIKADPVSTFNEWFDLQWRGGLVHENDIQHRGFGDRSPTLYDADTRMYRVEGIRDLVSEPSLVEDTFMKHHEIGMGMMEYYKDYAEAHDNFRVIAVEHDFSVPILDEAGNAMYAVDTRQMPEDWIESFDSRTIPENMYGPLMKMTASPHYILKQVHARGRMDNVIQDNEYGLFGIIDYKSTTRTDDAYFAHLDLDEQCTTYLWAGEREAQMYGFGHKTIDYIIYRALLKNYPKPPTITSRMLPSINRNEETCTAAQFEAVIAKMNLQDYVMSDPKMRAYYEWLLTAGDERFVVNREVRRNSHQKASCGSRIYYEAADMLAPDIAMYPNPTREYGCTKCVFRTPCVMKEDGSDYEFVLDNNYRSNWDR